MSEKVTYPVSEIFTSIQGEGVWTGTQMTFIRLAGCNIGQGAGPYTKCTSFDGREFTCDTDYRKTLILSVEELVKEIKAPKVCLTGGEPFLHDLDPLVRALAREAAVHVETSGTKPMPITGLFEWITCCPKKGFLHKTREAADEFKFVVDNGTNIKDIEDFCEGLTVPIYLQPINGITTLNHDNLRRVQALLETHPNWRLSTQLHKILGVR